MRIQTRPARFMWRVRARRAAALWRAVTRSGSNALSPNWPNARSTPEVAIPLMRPLCALRNLVRIGCSMAFRLSYSDPGRSGRVATRTSRLAFRHLLVLRHGVVLHDLALEDPDLHAAGAIGRESGRHAVIDVGTQGVERHTAFAIPFHARDLRAAEAARAIDTDAAGAQPHRRLHRALHRAAEGHPALELLRDRFGHELGIELRLP